MEGNNGLAMNDLEDLSNLFEFGDIDLNNIPDVGTAQYGDNGMPQQHATHPNTPFLDMGDPSLLSGNGVTEFGAHDQMDLMQGMENGSQYMGQQANPMPTSNTFITQSMYQPAVSQAHYPKDFRFRPQQGYTPSHHIPPTPNSYEMHGRPDNFMNQQASQLQHRALEQQRYQMQTEAVAFTPMASPAGTPQFHLLPEFTAPGAYFSPLSSPMLHAQNTHQAHLQGYVTHPNTAPSSNAPSPNGADMDIDLTGDAVLNHDLPHRRKSRRKTATPKGPTALGRAKSSPAQKAQKRKTSSKASEVDLRRAVTLQSSSASLHNHESSGAESASPEPLNESVMGPPPKPGSHLAQVASSTHEQDAAAHAVGTAATPKSLLQRRGAQHSTNGRTGSRQTSPLAELGGLDDLALPEAASDRPLMVAPIDTQAARPSVDDEDTPRLSARKTPKLGPSSTPSSARISTQTSPVIAGTPSTASTPAGILKDRKEGQSARGSKKRNSVSTGTPKNLPKISPSIKPLLPGGSPLHSSSQAILLASKSNYQNLLEGNHLPGVLYPDSLSTGLTSKRTSHKVAEQGRRNRINDALKEMQALVPKPSPTTKAAMKDCEASVAASPEDGGGEDEKGDEGGVGGKDDGGPKSSNSKAATVELANEYIRRMQREWAVRDGEMEKLREENERLRSKLGEGEGEGDQEMVSASPEGEVKE